MSKTKIYSRYDKPLSEGFDTGVDSIVDKNAAYDADINNIIKRYQSVEELEFELASKAKPMYGDSSCPYTISDIFQMKQGLQETYTSLPESVRNKFENYNDFISTVGVMSDSDLQGFFTDVSIAQKQLQEMYISPVVEPIQKEQTITSAAQSSDNIVQTN